MITFVIITYVTSSRMTLAATFLLLLLIVPAASQEASAKGYASYWEVTVEDRGGLPECVSLECEYGLSKQSSA